MHRVTSDSKRGRQLISVRIKASNPARNDGGVKPKAGWKFITDSKGNVQKVRV